MDLFDRIYRLHAVLRKSRYPVSHRRLEDELECKRATVNRIIKEMRLYLGAPIQYDRARNGYILAQGEDGPYELPGLWFSARELHALLAAHQLLANVEPGLLEVELAPLRGRIEQILQSRGTTRGEVGRRIRLLRMASRRVEPAHFRGVAEAVLARKRLRIVYHGRERDEITEREISPQRLVHYRDNWYLDAWDHRKRALRTFSIDRIRRSNALGKPVKDIPDARLDAHFASAYGIFAGRPRRKAVLRFAPERAQWVADELWHPRQQSRRLPGGAYELLVPYSDERELVMDILKYGPDVEVISPASLRQAVHARLRIALAQYTRAKSTVKGSLGAKSSKRTSRLTGSRIEPPPAVSFTLGSIPRRDFNS